jgi:dihydroxy-acid dehydratase
VGYVSPEAQVGGPLAIVRDGDTITIDCKSKRVDIDLEEAEIADRFASWEAPRPPITEGVLVDWHLTATQFPDGAMLCRRL